MNYYSCLISLLRSPYVAGVHLLLAVVPTAVAAAMVSGSILFARPALRAARPHSAFGQRRVC